MTISTPSVAERLKEETTELHRHAETRAMQKQLLKGELPAQTFSRYLTQLRLVHGGLENALDDAAPRDTRLSSVFRDQHRASLRIDRDLETYDAAPARGHTPLPATHGLLAQIEAWQTAQPIALLGPLYVLEGSMNGNRFIANVIRKAYGLQNGAGDAYLDPYGENQRAEWAAFKNDLTALEITADEADAIVVAAKHTFTAIAEISDTVGG